MLTPRKRGHNFHIDGRIGGSRIRGSLGTHNRDAALRLARQVDIALSEGAGSSLWPELKVLIPRSTYLRFARAVGVVDRPLPTWNDLQDAFKAYMEQRKLIGKLRTSTEQRYNLTLREFQLFLAERGIALLREITKPTVEAFKVWRIDRIKKRKFSRKATSLALDAAIIHRIFAFAIEIEMIVKNPVRMEGSPGENPERGAEPFTAEELSRLREHAAADMLAFLLLRWTGLRGGDAVSLCWKEVDFAGREIRIVTQKRKKTVVLPIHTALLFALEAEYQNRKPYPEDRVLLNPLTGNTLTRPRLYQRMLALGDRAGVCNAHPHRFRDTLAVDMLMRGASPYDVAKVLGDTIETVEKHYTPFVHELRERVRSILEKGAGLESLVTPASQSTSPIQ